MSSHILLPLLNRVSAAAMLLCLATPALSQAPLHGMQLLEVDPSRGLASNSVSDVLVHGGTVWLGTGNGLTRALAAGDTLESYGRRHGLGRGGVSALGIHGNAIWAATTFDSLTADAGILPTGSGLSYSLDDGATWQNVPQPGLTPVQNVTFDIAFLGNTIWITSWGGGLRKSDDFGQTWEIVTPDTLVHDAFKYLNHRAFSVINADGVLWVGTAGGVNKSLDGGRTWTNFSRQNQAQPISGNFVVALGQQKYDDYDIIWAATVEAEDTSEYRGVSYSLDQGYSWNVTLEGEFAHNFAFDDSIVYVASDHGIFKSVDLGKNWTHFPPIRDRVTGDGMLTDEQFAVGVDPDKRLWVAGPDGAAVSDDGGLTWEIKRTFWSTRVQSSPRTYAYPNPFSPLRHNLVDGDGNVRFQYNTTGPAQITVKVYDGAMDLVQTVADGRERPGAGDYYEVWNGLNMAGEPTANGVYFYSVDISGDGMYWGKVIVLD